MRRYRRQPDPARRRGTLMPAIVVAIGVVCLCAALVFDRIWLDAARVELRTAAEAAAFAATRQLTTDDLLKPDADSAAMLAAARTAAALIAAENHVAGSPVILNATPGGDIRFGKVTDEPHTGQPVFLETDFAPTTVLVTAQAIRSRGNGVALFFRRLTGVATGNVIGRAGVMLDNKVMGVRPFSGATVPALPLGILAFDSTTNREDTWNRQITHHAGSDHFGFDSKLQRVTDGPDGIPEMILVCSTPSPITGGDSIKPTERTNCCVVDIGNELMAYNVRKQIVHGWSPRDLADYGGQFLVDGSIGAVNGSFTLLAELGDDLASIIGQPRICVLYQHAGNSDEEIGKLSITQLVAGRILVVTESSDALQIVFQPSVITTPTAVLAAQGEHVAANPYIYKLHLTH